MAVSVEEAKADYLAAKQAIGKNDLKIIFVRKCKLEGKHEKSEAKIFVITTFRIYVITKKSNSKVDFSFHLLDLQSLDSSKPLALTAMVNAGEKQFQYTFTFTNQDDVDRSISYIKALLRKNLLNTNVDKHLAIKVESAEKQEMIRNQTSLIEQSFSTTEGGLCGGLAQAYLFLCDYYGQVPIAEIVWDINKIYGSHSCRDFKLEDFDNLEQKEVIPLIAALSYNTWFKRFIVKKTKLVNELVDAIVKVVKRSPSIEEVFIVDCHINKEQAHKISQAISVNPNKTLKRLDISKNNIEEKGISGIAASISSLQHGLESLNFAHCGITTKGATILINALNCNKNMASSLVSLSLSGNALKSDAAQTLCEFLAQPNVLETLNLSSTESALDLVFGAMMRGCQQHLKNLDLSGNPFSYRKSKETQSLPTFQQFFSTCAALKTISLGSTKLPSEAIKAILVGLMRNPFVTDVELDISNNELKSSSCQEIASVIGGIRCLRKLNLSNNALDQDLVAICEAVQESSSIKELDFTSTITKSKHISSVSEALADMVMSETLHLEKLHIADNKLRLAGASPIFDCLGTNESITFIDISGNAIGDDGARLLAKALQINTSLREVNLDYNNISYKGIQDISCAMNRNFTLHSLPLPFHDFSATIKHNADLYMKYYKQIEKKLTKNQSTTDSSPEQAYKIQQGFLLSTSHSYTQSTDALVVELQDLVSKNKSNTDEKIQSQVRMAKSIIWETDTFREVLADLFSDPVSARKSLIDKASSVADEVATSVEAVIKENVDAMLISAKKICPTVFSDEEKLFGVKEELVKKGLVDKTSIHNVIVKLGKTDVMHKLCKSNLGTASDVAESLKILLIQSLQDAINALKTVKSQSPTSPVTNEPASLVPPVVVESQDGDVKAEEEEKAEEAPKEENSDAFAVSEDEPPVSPLSPMITIHETTDLLGEILGDKESFDVPWDLAAGNRLSMQQPIYSDDNDELSLAVLKARDRLSTLQGKEFHQKKKKNASLKRRPTFYRAQKTDETKVEINISMADTGVSSGDRSGPITTTAMQESDHTSLDETDSAIEEDRDHLSSIGSFDALTTKAVPLRVNKDRAKPMAGRRPPSRVSHLAHMNTESMDKFIEDAKKPTPEASPKPLPKQRPMSEMPKEVIQVPEQDKPPRRSTSEKLKHALSPRPAEPKPPKPQQPEAKKEKKGKSPIGGIKLPSLSALKRGRTPSKAAELKKEEENEASTDKVDGKKEEAADEPVKPPTPPPPVEEEKLETPPSEVATPEVTPEPSLKPEAPKRPVVPKPGMGMPMMGGLMAEMKLRQNKGEPPAPVAKPKPPTPAIKPEGRTGSVSGRVGSISGPKPPPPARPSSIKRPGDEKPPVSDDKPKPSARPRPPPASEKPSAEKGNEEDESENKPEKEKEKVEAKPSNGNGEKSEDTII